MGGPTHIGAHRRGRGGHRHWQVGRMPDTNLRSKGVKDCTFLKIGRQRSCPLPQSLSIAVLQIHDILVWIRIQIRGSMPLTNGSGSTNPDPDADPDPSFFIIDLQDANKKNIL
jgi:hypothetical protein